ncbi:hypothetical protein [Sphingomonas sp.]|uniref:hypothetical protein n=1 Tax=Sphingomonas sp. TaxID=28214 RepID=UPI0035B2F611
MRPLLRLLAPLLLWLASVAPAQAAVTITFWSHELGNSFPHTFFSLRGVADAGGPPVDSYFGFTARSVSPALLFGSVAGRLDRPTPGYVSGSDAQFSVVMTDAQYADILALIAGWSEDTGDSRYDLGTRNCIHFVKEAASRLGLTGLDHPRLMRKPRSYLKAVAAANVGRVTLIGRHGKDHLATLPPIEAPAQPAGTISITSSSDS